jgi:hypothetical protein
VRAQPKAEHSQRSRRPCCLVAPASSPTSPPAASSLPAIVLEGLATIGLAGNIVQFISFGFTLVAKSREIHHSASGVPEERIDLDLIARDIRAFSRRLMSAQDSSTELIQVAQRCSAAAKKLLDAVSEIQLKHANAISGRNSTRLQQWRSFRKALKYVWRKDEIQGLKTRLEAIRDQMTMHMISGMK